MAVNLDLIFGSAGGIHEGTSYHGKEHVALLENANARAPWIANISHMIQGARNFAVPTTGALGVIDLYVGHGEVSWPIFNIVATRHRAWGEGVRIQKGLSGGDKPRPYVSLLLGLNFRVSLVSPVSQFP
jgi:hypothetical protein